MFLIFNPYLTALLHQLTSQPLPFQHLSILPKGTVGAFLSEVSEFYKKQTKVPLDIYEGPLQFTLGQQNSLARLTSHTLFQRRLQIRGLQHFDPNGDPCQQLSALEYHKHHLFLGEMKLKTENFKTTAAPQTARRSRRNQIRPKTKSFDRFILARSIPVQIRVLGAFLVLRDRLRSYQY